MTKNESFKKRRPYLLRQQSDALLASRTGGAFEKPRLPHLFF